MIFPSPLRPGDTVGIMAPATVIKPEYVHGAVARLRDAGFKVRLMPHTLGPACGTYASAADTRLSDLVELWEDPQVRAVLCARGGYGCVQLLEHLPGSLLLSDPKWLIGFSDVSALHARLHAAGIASLHSNMCKHLASEEVGAVTLERILALIGTETPRVEYSVEITGPQQAEGMLVGGNLAVLSHLIATPWDLLGARAPEGTVLFLEDVSEAVYSTERMLFQLHLAGILRRQKAIIVGQFTKARADANWPDTLTMIRSRFRQWGIEGAVPVVYDFPVGHILHNLPLLEGAHARLTPGKLTLTRQ